jgi:perosamine synthetase
LIPWWQTSFDGDEIELVTEAISHGNISQGSQVEYFEYELSQYLNVKNVVAVSNGSVALLLSLIACGVGPGDEVIVPDRTWIATAHAVRLLGASVRLVDVEGDLPIMDSTKIESLINRKTKAIIPVHMNGRAVNLRQIQEIADKYALPVIEDAAQALGSRNADGFLGTQGSIGCFSLSVAKIISSGQGGFAVTNDDNLAKNMRAMRTHGVENVKDPQRWPMLGFNFRFTDVLASIGRAQLSRIDQRIAHLISLYERYEQGLKETGLKLIPVDLKNGEIPLYIECVADGQRDDWIKYLEARGVDTRPFYPSVNRAPYLGLAAGTYPNSVRFEERGIYLPSGPTQPLENVDFCIDVIKGRP